LDLKVREVDRDENLAVIQKSISVPNSFSISTPSKATRASVVSDYIKENSLVNEIPQRIDALSLEALEKGSSSRKTKEMRLLRREKALNLVISNLAVDRFPERHLMQTFAAYLHACSENVIFLPTVNSSLLKEPPQGKKTPIFSDARFAAYVAMMSNLVKDIQDVGNNKAFMGTIPLVPIKYARLIIGLYHKMGIRCFAIDANTMDVFFHEADLRAILSEINQGISLSEAFIYACNLGYPKYERNEARADDFLSLFAYIDVIGNTFKQRAIKKPKTFNGAFRPRHKLFSNDDYSYKIMESVPIPRSKLEVRNQVTQLMEAHYVRDLLGEENLARYIGRKKAVDKPLLGKLEVIASDFRVK
jgi:hypothetical protein